MPVLHAIVIKNNRLITFLFLVKLLFLIPGYSYCQKANISDSTQTLTLEQCIKYAFINQPALNRAIVNRAIVRTSNAINLSGWMPQVNVSGNLTHYYQLPPTIFANQYVHEGVINSALPGVSASETLFNPQLLYFAKDAPLSITTAEQVTDSEKINIVASVSKSFYSLLLTLQQVNVLKEDTIRLGRNVLDTYKQYIGGIVDETDYQEAVITLNNSKAQLKQQQDNITPEYAILKQLMGFPPDKQFNVAFDTLQMMQQIAFDTTQLLQYENRIEYQQLQSVKKRQHLYTTYNKLSSLPTISVFYNYYHEFLSNTNSTLFANAYPYSYIGLSLNIPLFTGFSHLESIHRSKLQEQVLNLDELSLKSQIYTDYTTALANYKSNLYNWRLLKENEMRAKNVYSIVAMQYMQGTVAYLNLIVAESNLIESEIGSINALFQLLSRKIDLEKAIGIIPYNNY